MKKIAPYIALVFIIVVSFIAGYHSDKRHDTPKTEEVTVETIKDTIPYTAPKPVSESGLGTQSFTLPRYYFIGSAGGISRQQSPSSNTDTLSEYEINAMPDTIGNAYGCVAGEADSTVVELPIIQRHYADSTYEAWVSGPVDPRLDSIRVYSRRERVTIRKPPNKWHIGPSVGVGITPHGAEPYIGISLTYSIISF